MALSPAAMARMRERQAELDAQAARRGGGGSASVGRQSRDTYSFLYGKSETCIVQPGFSVILRVAPRWDIINMYMRDPKTGKTVVNPNYNEQEELIYVEAWEHWFDDSQGQRVRIWCPQTREENAACPVCEEAARLDQIGGENNRKQAWDMMSKKVYLYNVIVRKKYDMGGKKWVDAQYTAEGKPNFRILPVGEVVHRGIMKVITGGQGGEEFAKGAIWDIKGEEGHDLQVTRPSKQGERYGVTCANAPSPLYEVQDVRWKGWMALLHDLSAEIAEDKVLSYDALYQMYYGQAPTAGVGTPGEPVDSSDSVDGFEGDGAGAPAEAEVGTPETDYQFLDPTGAGDEGVGAGFASPDETPEPTPPARQASKSPPAASRAASTPPQRRVPPTPSKPTARRGR